jgi:hypothetical protein
VGAVALARDAHLSDDEAVAKMGHPRYLTLLDGRFSASVKTSSIKLLAYFGNAYFKRGLKLY